MRRDDRGRPRRTVKDVPSLFLPSGYDVLRIAGASMCLPYCARCRMMIAQLHRRYGALTCLTGNLRLS